MCPKFHNWNRFEWKQKQPFPTLRMFVKYTAAYFHKLHIYMFYDVPLQSFDRRTESLLTLSSTIKTHWISDLCAFKWLYNYKSLLSSELSFSLSLLQYVTGNASGWKFIYFFKHVGADVYFMAAIIKSQEIKKTARFGWFLFPSFDFRSTNYKA